MISARKAGQIAAFFASKQGGTISVLKLMKLMYLGDREAMRRFGFPISYDRFVSMPHGPVLSECLDLIAGGAGERSQAAWDEWMGEKANHQIRLNRLFERSDLDELSDAELEALEVVWCNFGHMDQWTLRDYTHDNCPEWSDPNGSSIEIAYADVFRALGVADEAANYMAAEIQSERALDRAFAKL